MSTVIGDKETFAIEYEFIDDNKLTEIKLYHDYKNILSYKKNNVEYTTRWNLDELVLWLKNFIENLSEDEYPVSTVAGEFAAQKDDNTRDFDTDDDDEFERYYNKLYKWNLKHRWHSVNTGEIIADMYFQLVGDNVELSWNNKGLDTDITFSSIEGGFCVKKDLFITIVNQFIEEYQSHWNT